MLISLAVPIKVLLHLECFNELNNMYHIGISFHEKTRNIRFDYRAFNDGRSYETTEKQRLNVYDMFPDNPLKFYTDQKLYVQYRKYMEERSKTILWGETNKSMKEIVEYEENLHKRYIIGIYDCRHYVHDFTYWCMNKATPIWKLDELWYKDDENIETN